LARKLHATGGLTSVSLVHHPNPGASLCGFRARFEPFAGGGSFRAGKRAPNLYYDIRVPEHRRMGM